MVRYLYSLYWYQYIAVSWHIKAVIVTTFTTQLYILATRILLHMGDDANIFNVSIIEWNGMCK